MTYSHITISALNKGERIEFWFVFQTNHATFAEQMADFTQTGGLVGTRHDTAIVRDEDGRNIGRQITNSYAFYIGKAAVISAAEFNVPLYDLNSELIE